MRASMSLNARVPDRLSVIRNTLLAVVALLLLPAVALSHSASTGKQQTTTVALSGKLTQVHGDDFKNRKARDQHWELTQGFRRYRLRPRETVKLRPGTPVLVRGVRRGRTIAVRSMRARAGKPPRSVNRKGKKISRKRRHASKRIASASGYAPGGRKVAVLLVQFDGSTSVAPTAESMRERVFLNPNSPNAFFKEESGGATFLTGKVRSDGDVFGPYTVPATSGCDTGTWDAQARAAAEAEGHDMTGYDHYVTVWPAVAACPWAGSAGTGSWWVDMNTTGSQMESAMAHELGHNMGVHHATAYNCTDGSKRVTLSATCTTDEYGDRFDTMACCYYLGHNTASRKARWGWLEPGSDVTATEPGSFLLSPMEKPTAGQIQSLRIPRPAGDFYYLEFRQPFGFDAFDSTSPVVNGVSIRLSGGYNTNMKSYLLDMTPQTSSFTDAPLAGGRSYFAADINKTIVVDSTSPLGASMRLVEGNYTPPDTVAPTTTLTPSDGATVKGSKVTVKGTATDASGVSRVELSIDGTAVASAAGSSVSYSWPLRSASAGRHVLVARAYDARGNVGSATSTVTK
jgi:hypothetical protein